ncbi:MAG TPA: hypothetical protein VGW75_04240 [Solirubrobacteraceae bacterium]|jgi:hypothetical protein|nr:hypothetical protein [Solirubrobacteraceae bacterium]
MTRSLRRRLAAQDGWAVVTAIVVMSIVLGLGLTTYSFVSTQQRESGLERTRESSFNVAEGALTAQIFSLSRRWPAPDGVGAPPADRIYATCTPSSGNDLRCPRASQMAALFRNRDTDVAGEPAWTTNVYDNGGGSEAFYDDSVTPQQPGWDANDDGRLWVRAQAAVRGKQRTLVALVGVQKQTEELPRAAVVAGAVELTNSGKKVLIDANGDTNAYQPGIVAVRCTDLSDPKCFKAPKFDDQLDPPVASGGYSAANALPDDVIQRLRERAITDQTYYATCAQALAHGLAGEVVYVEGGGECAFTGNATYNTAEEPGLLIWAGGTLTLGGGTVYHGLVYHLHQDTAQPAVRLQGNAQVIGGVMIDGDGRIEIGSSKKNVVFDERAHKNVRSYSTAGIIQNTWREIRPAS